MFRHRTPFPNYRAQQCSMIDLLPNTPVEAAFVVGVEGVEGGEHVWEVRVWFSGFEQAGEMEYVGAGEGY